MISIQQFYNLKFMFDVVVDLYVDADADTIAAVEAKRKALLPNLSEVTFIEMSIQNKPDEEYNGHCNGTLPPNKQADDCLKVAKD